MMVTMVLMVTMVGLVTIVVVVVVTWPMAWSCPRVSSGPGQTERLAGRSLPSDPDMLSDMLKYKHHSTAGRGSRTHYTI